MLRGACCDFNQLAIRSIQPQTHWSRWQALAIAASPARDDGGDAGARPAEAAADLAAVDDDATTVRMDDLHPPSSPASSPDGGDSEDGEESSCTSDKSVDDVPNLASGSNGVVGEGMDLKALKVGTLPPTPPSSPDAGQELITPPPKRVAPGQQAHPI